MSYLVANPEDRFSHDEAHIVGKYLQEFKTISNYCQFSLSKPGARLFLLTLQLKCTCTLPYNSLLLSEF